MRFLPNKEEFLAKVEEAKEAVRDIEEQYRVSAFQVYLSHALSNGKTRVVAAENSALQITGIPEKLIAKLGELSSRDIIFLMLRYEKTPMTKEEMILQSRELGKPLTPSWMSDHFSEKTRGFLAEVRVGDETAYKFSAKGLLDFDNRVKEILEAAQ